MASARFLLISGEILSNNDKSDLIRDAFEGLSTCPPDVLQLLRENLSSLPERSESAAIDDGILLCRSGSDLTFTLACRPSANGVASLMSELLAPPSKPEVGLNAVLVYTGLIAEGSGHWLLPNYLFTPTLFADNLEKLVSACPKPVDTENQPQYKHVHIHIGFAGSSTGGDWRQLSTYHFDSLGGHPIQISINQLSYKQKPVAVDCAPDLSALNSWLQNLFAELPTTYCTPLTRPLTCRDPGDPTLRVARPCLYVFPEGSGQSAILTLPGYSMLVDAGCMHRPCFWPVASHLDRLDSVFLTHWGVNNLLGMCAVLPVAFAPAPPEIGSQDSVLCLLTPPPNPAQIFNFPEPSPTRSSLILSLPRQVSKLINQIKQSGANLVVQPLTRGAKLSAPTQPIQLYQKVGQGSLELYALTPGDDESAELRRLNDDWAKASPSLMTTPVTLCKSNPANKFSVPLLSHTSVSALAVWRPARDTEPILRILFVSPTVHQTRVLLSLEAVVAANIYLRHAKAIPAEYERKRPVNPVPRRSNMPSAIGAKAPSVSSVASLGVKPPAKRLTTVPATHSTTVKHNEKTHPVSKSMPTKTGPINNTKAKTPDSAANTLLERVVPVVPMDHQELDLMQPNGDQNGYHSNPSAEFEPQHALSANMAGLDLDAETHEDGLIPDDNRNHVQPEFPASTGLVDPIASWGDPQELPPPAPPIGKL
ncbi:Microtubule-associated protein futsch [Paragonimus westermani]|uniref:Microtubule-associated protein futsch n=1 Tax=Paragonimus westermani TaxID=34504 RepID=A0A8T0DGC2_9TREM|nr:Microtubule-associated protein futsch [Paragonimus westermani]